MLRLLIDTQSSGGSSVSDKSEGPGWWQASDGQWYPTRPASVVQGRFRWAGTGKDGGSSDIVSPTG